MSPSGDILLIIFNFRYDKYCFRKIKNLILNIDAKGRPVKALIWKHIDNSEFLGMNLWWTPIVTDCQGEGIHWDNEEGKHRDNGKGNRWENRIGKLKDNGDNEGGRDWKKRGSTGRENGGGKHKKNGVDKHWDNGRGKRRDKG